MDLGLMLAGLTVSRRAGTFVVCSLPTAPPLGNGVEALIAEHEGVTVVCGADVASGHGWATDFTAAWLTLDVHSSLEAVGLTAAVSTALTDAGIACNMVAGAFHDHLLVPVERVEDAVVAIERLGSAR